MWSEIAEQLEHCKLVVVMGSETYGQRTASINSTFEELQFILSEGKDFFLIKMCDRFKCPHTRMAFGSGIVYKHWAPGTDMPPGLVTDVVQALGVGEDEEEHQDLSELMFFSCPIFEDAPEELLLKMRSHLLHTSMAEGELIIRHGDEGDSMYFLQHGAAELQATFDRLDSDATDSTETPLPQLRHH